MKKTLLALLVLVLGVSLLALVGCGGGSKDVSDNKEVAEQEAVVEEAPEVVLEEGPIVESMTYEELTDALRDFDLDKNSTTYDDVAEYLGVHGFYDESSGSESKDGVKWYASDDGFVTIYFMKDTGFYSSWSGSGFGRP